jgi:hypothetical protein
MANPTIPTSASARLDQIRERYYRPLELAESCSLWIFWIVAVLSILALAVERKTNPDVYDFVQVAFVIGVAAFFLLGLAIRLYWTPRAEDKRRQGLLSDSFGVALVHEQVTGYYNNDQSNPVMRLGASLMENSFFSKRILLAMARGERVRIGLYILVWFAALLHRSTDLALLAAIAQAIFSEQIISRGVRLEWLRNRFECVYDDLYRLFQTTTDFNRDEFRIRVLEEFGEYETSKGYGGIMLSKKVFDRMNPDLSAEWEQIRRQLKL